MCGFAGVLNFDGTPVDAAVLKRMSRSIAHRGPDDEGHVLLRGAGEGSRDPLALPFREPGEVDSRGGRGFNLGFGFRRLSIIDISAAGHQPMSNEDGTVWVVFNGEFYNSHEYVDDLKARGHRFRSATDTEVILHLYEEFGLEGTLQRMTGMFAFALGDLRRRTLYLVRDRVGIKPLYYYKSPKTLIFGSEVKAILAAPSAPRIFDTERLPELLSNRYLNAPNTVFRGIRKALPGSYWAFGFDDPEGREVRYWSLFDNAYGKRAADVEDYRGALIRSVSLRMRSDVPLGIFLSGGLDSSTVCAVVREELGNELETFSVEFEGSPLNEAWASREVASHLGTQHHAITFAVDPLGSMPKIAWHCEEPIADAALLPTYYLAEFTRRHVVVAQSGEGSDESNYGYSRYLLGRTGQALRMVPSTLERVVLPALETLLKEPDAAEVARFLRKPTSDHDREGFFTAASLERLLSPDLANVPASRGSWWKREWSARSVLDVRPLIHFHTWLEDDLLLKVDKMSMAHSLEVRVPYLDHNVLAVAFGMSARRKLAGGNTKAVLRKVASSYLPSRIWERDQHGFNVPLAEAFTQDLFSSGGKRHLAGYLEPAGPILPLDRVLSTLAPGGTISRDAAVRLWLLAMIGLTISSFELTVG